MPAEVTLIAAEADDTAAIRLALDYPYERHDHAFWYENGHVEPRVDVATARTNRMPVIAFGSNAAPRQLARKFSGQTCGESVFVEPVALHGWDVIYAARITRYGAIPARMIEAVDCMIHVHLTWLSAAQVAWMDATEGSNYVRAVLPSGRAVDRAGQPVAMAEAYLGGGDPLRVDGGHAALSAVKADGRTHASHDTAALLDRLAARAEFPGSVEEFALFLVREEGFVDSVLPLMRLGL